MIVMAGLVPAIHEPSSQQNEDVWGKPGHDETAVEFPQ
ncbi:hypothetical protein ABIA43_002834 [Bradyrhizobium sp. USDA 328]